MNPAPYRVIWKRSATDIQLVNIVNWLLERGDPLGPVTSAVTRIDQLLASDPAGAGESRPRFERILSVAPLTV